MEQGPAAISSASAMALSNQTIDLRKSDVAKIKLNSQREESIIDVVETSDRDPRERLEYGDSRLLNQGTDMENACHTKDAKPTSLADRQGAAKLSDSADENSTTGDHLDIQA